jgi:hypothetical protein
MKAKNQMEWTKKMNCVTYYVGGQAHGMLEYGSCISAMPIGRGDQPLTNPGYGMIRIKSLSSV